jgi:para-nitrobenzyl esterase
LFFIHGGAHMRGSSSDRFYGTDLYDGSYLAAHGPAIVVTINYRLGALGYLVHPALEAESPQHASGNYGLLDEIAALSWVQRNIAAFGGDPARVLVFGQSAGAYDTCVLVASPLAKGLFSRAMMLSGQCSTMSHATAQLAGERFANDLGCDHDQGAADCLRAKSGAEIATQKEVFGDGGILSTDVNGPAVDGWAVPDQPMKLIQSGLHNRVPMIVSTTADEFTIMLGRYGTAPVANDMEYVTELTAMFGATGANLVSAMYPSSSYSSASYALVAVLTDLIFTCPARRALRTLSSAQSEPVRRAFFTHSIAAGGFAPYRAAHGFDMLFGFHRIEFPGTSPTPEEEQLSEVLAAAWTRFAATGDPDGASSPAWPVYDPQDDAYIDLDTPPSSSAGVRTAKCDFWDAHL